jgi:2-(1,2-epoxy-1,2-dihydrophenyl)acetyl-CoA isomerase
VIAGDVIGQPGAGSMGHRIEFSVADRVARIVLARPDARNAIDAPLLREFAEAATACADDATLVAIVISAQGEWFSAGGDLREFLAHREHIFPHLLEGAGVLHVGVLALRRASAPVIAAVGGVAAGAGFSLVCGADLVVATESARFVSAYTGSGLTPDGGGTFFLPRIVGYRIAFDLMATNPVLSAAEAKALGIVSRIVADGDLDSEVDKLVAHLAAQPEGAIAALKALFRLGENELAARLDAERDFIATRGATPATLARIEAFLKPKPR